MPIDHCRDLWVVTYCGVRAVQYWADFLNWEDFLNQFPAKSFIEIGTGNGGLSLFLAAACLQKGIEFHTIDIFPCASFDTPLGRLHDLRAKQLVGDIFETPILTDLLQAVPRPCIMLCDNGNKPREFRTFVPALRPGDWVAVHDWLNEFGPGDVLPVKDLVQETFVQASGERGTLTRWYMRV